MGGVSADGQGPIPLARLLVIGYRLLVDTLHRRLGEDGWDDVRPAHGFVLLATRDGSTTTTDLAGVLGVSKQAASKLLDQMVAGGYVERTPDPSDARQRVIALAPRGRRLLAAVEQIYVELEAEWAAQCGRPAVESMRATLTQVAATGDRGDLPAVRAPRL